MMPSPATPAAVGDVEGRTWHLWTRRPSPTAPAAGGDVEGRIRRRGMPRVPTAPAAGGTEPAPRRRPHVSLGKRTGRRPGHPAHGDAAPPAVFSAPTGPPVPGALPSLLPPLPPCHPVLGAPGAGVHHGGSRPCRPALRLLSLNVNGLHEPAKRRQLFAMLQQQAWDVVCLQETHHSCGDQAAGWCKAGRGAWLFVGGAQTFWHAGASDSRGVAVLFRAGVPVEDVVVGHQDGAGRVLRVDFSFGEMELSVISVYAPCVPGSEQNAFFTTTLMAALPGQRSVLMDFRGDFNCVASVLDQVGASSTSGRRRGYAAGLAHVERRFGLVDVWREQNPGVTDFTHTATSGASSARLDRWLVSGSLLPATSRAHIEGAFPGDHLAVTLAVEDPAGTIRGPGMWCFPLPLLSDEGFVEQLAAHIPHFLAAHPLQPPIYTRRDRWDELKASIRDLAQARGKHAAVQRRSVQREQEHTARRAKAAYVADPGNTAALHAWQDAQHSLQAGQARAHELAALRAGAVWQDFGEQPTHFFHHLAAERAAATSMHSLRDAASGESFALDSTAGRDRAAGVLRRFFAGDADGGLFQPRPVSVDAQDTLLGSLDARLDLSGRAACDAPVTEEELLALEGWRSPLRHAGSARAAMGCRMGCRTSSTGSFGTRWGVSWRWCWRRHSAARRTSRYRHCSGRGASSCSSRGAPALYESAPRPIGRSRCRTWTSSCWPWRWPSDGARTWWRWWTSPRPASCRVASSATTSWRTWRRWTSWRPRSSRAAWSSWTSPRPTIAWTRGWLRRCMGALGFGARACRWVDVLLGGSLARVSFNGWRTDAFPVLSGVPQGSPLSPLLYVIAAQPLASRMRQLQTQGRVRGISLPDGSSAPVCHQHADDTTLHVSTVRDVTVALDEGVDVFAAASGAALQPAKSKALLLGGGPTPPPRPGPHPLPRPWRDGAPPRHPHRYRRGGVPRSDV